jgi:DNA replication protein DnaC
MQVLKEIAGYRTLILDDLGAEKQTDFSAATLYAIIARRRNWQQLTIVTSNQTLEEINAWEPRLASRLAEFHPIRLPDIDRRIQR